MAAAVSRVYLPATLAVLAPPARRGVHAAGRASAPTPSRPELREWYADGDEEELEYVAFTRAAQAALLLLQHDPDAPRRRAVIAVDSRPSRSSGSTRSWDRVRCGSTPRSGSATSPPSTSTAAAAEADVAAAVAVVREAAAGDEDAQFTVDGAEDHELEWYDPSELDELLGSPWASERLRGRRLERTC